MRNGVPLAAAAVATLALAASAQAHVKVSPEQVAPGSTHVFVFSAPNERDVGEITALRLHVPAGLTLGEIEAQPGWTARVRGSSVVWTGGPISPGEFARFAILATTPRRGARLSFRAAEVFADGTVARYRPKLVVAPGAAARASRSGRDEGARTLGKFALGVAAGAAALAALAGFGVLGVWLLSPERRTRGGREREQTPSALAD